MRMDDTVNATRGKTDFNEAFAFIDERTKRIEVRRNVFRTFAIGLCYSAEGILANPMDKYEALLQVELQQCRLGLREKWTLVIDQYANGNPNGYACRDY